MGKGHPTGTQSVTASIVGCDDLSGIRRHILEPVRQLLGGDSAVFLQFRRDARGCVQVESACYEGRQPKSVHDYVRGEFRNDPILKPMMQWSDRWTQAHEPMLWHLKATMPHSALRSSAYYREFLSPNHLGDIIAVAAPANIDGPQLLCIGIHREEGSGDFDELHSLALDAISQPLRLSLRSACLQSALAEQRGRLFDLADQTDIEFAILDAAGAPLETSPRMTGVLDALARGSQPALSEAIRCLSVAAGDDRRPAHTIELALDDGATCALRRLAGGAQPRFLVTSTPHDSTPRPPAIDALDTSAEPLTAREREVARLVASGARNREIATTLGISVRTVENHLRNVYEKLGVSSRGRLITLLISRGERTSAPH